MPNTLQFEIQPIEGSAAAIGEAVTFKRENETLYALNEDGEAFGIVPSEFAATINNKIATAEIVAREAGGIFSIEVTFNKTIEPLETDITEASAEPSSAIQAPEEPLAETDNAVTTTQTSVAFTATAGTTSETAAQADAPDAMPTQQPAHTATISSTNTDTESSKQSNAQNKKIVKKIVAILKNIFAIIGIIFVILVICVTFFDNDTEESNNQQNASSDDTQSVTSGLLTIEVPESWTIGEETTNNSGYIQALKANDYDGGISLGSGSASELGLDTMYEVFDTDEIQESIMEDYFESPINEYTTVNGWTLYYYECDEPDEDTNLFYGILGLSESGMFTVLAYCAPDDFDSHADELKEIVDNTIITNSE